MPVVCVGSRAFVVEGSRAFVVEGSRASVVEGSRASVVEGSRVLLVAGSGCRANRGTYSPQRGCDRASLAGCCRSGEGVMTGVPPQLSWRAGLYHNRWWSAVRARVCKGRARSVPRGESSFGFSRGFCWSLRRRLGRAMFR